MSGMDLGSHTGSLVNHVLSRGQGDAPQVGMGVTVLGWTDRHAGTIVSVDAKGFDVRLDTATRTDGNGMSECQDYVFAPNPGGTLYRFARVARGKAKGSWRSNGQSAGKGVLLGRREHYYDFSF